MSDSRTDVWQAGTHIYTEDQIAAVLREVGVEVKEETENDFVSLCPYHGNRDTPAFSTSKEHGASVCFNPSCGETASLEKLVRDLKGTNIFQTRRIINKMKTTGESYAKDFVKATEKIEIFKEFPQSRLDAAYERFWNHEPAQRYMMEKRHFTEETLRYFRVGYGPEIKADPLRHIRPKPASVLVPMYDPKGTPVGYIGRSLEGKDFNNSPKLPRRHTIWNLHNAKRHESIILTEASFDGMRIHQAGYPNVGALLGGSLSEGQIQQIKRHFSKVIIFTDNDDPYFNVRCNKCLKLGYKKCMGHNAGRELGQKIANSLGNIRVSWAVYNDEFIYPTDPLEGYRKGKAKDAGNMTDDEIRTCLKNAISDFEYQEWVA